MINAIQFQIFSTVVPADFMILRESMKNEFLMCRKVRAFEREKHFLRTALRSL